VLERSGLVRSEKVGRVRTCRIEPLVLRTAEDWISERRAGWERRLDRLGDYLATSADWSNTRLVNENVAEEIAKLKQEPGKGPAIMGSPSLTVSLLGMGLVDELRVMVHPVLLGGGRSLFQSIDGRRSLELRQTRTFSSGNVLLTYRPA
jgi:riboflavin biosynthesis pyrimidine reductase